jgi:nucleoside-diphosphate-sugar epimerase
MRVLVTGANGLVGAALMRRLDREIGVQPFAGVRAAGRADSAWAERVLGDLSLHKIDVKVLSDIEVVVHSAARVHVMQERARDPMAAFRSVNVGGTRALLEAAAQAGVRRFVFVSSIKVNGEASPPGRGFSEQDEVRPQDPYSRSKWEAEQLVQAFCEQQGIEWVVVRPPLVYGPGVGVNFNRLIRVLAFGLPLPLGGLDNRRSLVALENLVDLLACCVSHPLAANERFLVSDGQDLSVTELSRRLVVALGSRSWLLPLPGTWLNALTRMLGGSAVSKRLCGELRVDSGKARRVLDWQAPQSVDEALAATVQDFIQKRGRH